MPIEQNSNFYDLNYINNVINNPILLKKKCIEVINQIMVKPYDYTNRFLKVDEIFKLNTLNNEITPDGMNSVTKAVAGLLNFI